VAIERVDFPGSPSVDQTAPVTSVPGPAGRKSVTDKDRDRDKDKEKEKDQDKYDPQRRGPPADTTEQKDDVSDQSDDATDTTEEGPEHRIDSLA
jgi:hypothetical protein